MTEIPDWIDMKPEEIEELIIELAEKGHPPSQIGIILRDQYGIPNVNKILNKNMLEILEDHGASPNIPEDLLNLMKKAVKMRNHLDKYPNDLRTQRTLDELESNIHKLAKYYKKNDLLPEDWRYDPEEAALLVQS